jgi:predicted CXXCH cytochrome family protein
MTHSRRLASAVVGLTLLTLAPAAGPDPALVISPPGNAVLPAGPFYVICKGGPADLAVDGRRQAWGAFTGPVRAARLRLGPGHHEVRVGQRTVALWVEGRPAPRDWAPVRLHPLGAGADACAACHQASRRDGRTAVGPVKSFAACLECHKPAQFELKHAHPLEPLKHCGSCHAPHGAPHKGLLKAPAKQLCAACHDS